MATRKTEVEISEHTCAATGCGVSFWITEGFEERRRSRKDTFYCPNGHSLSYPGETDEAKLARVKREKDAEIARLERELAASKRKPRAKRK